MHAKMLERVLVPCHQKLHYKQRSPGKNFREYTLIFSCPRGLQGVARVIAGQPLPSSSFPSLFGEKIINPFLLKNFLAKPLMFTHFCPTLKFFSSSNLFDGHIIAEQIENG